MLPSVATVSRSACRLGSSGFAVRQSARALGGFVAVAGFATPAAASSFARGWAIALPRGCNGCVVRRAGGLAWVSVPVLPASAPALVRRGSPLAVCGSPPACRSAVAAGGVWSW